MVTIWCVPGCVLLMYSISLCKDSTFRSHVLTLSTQREYIGCTQQSPARCPVASIVAWDESCTASLSCTLRRPAQSSTAKPGTTFDTKTSSESCICRSAVHSCQIAVADQLVTAACTPCSISSPPRGLHDCSYRHRACGMQWVGGCTRKGRSAIRNCSLRASCQDTPRGRDAPLRCGRHVLAPIPRRGQAPDVLGTLPSRD